MVTEASKSVNFKKCKINKPVYVKNMQATLENKKVAQYRVTI